MPAVSIRLFLVAMLVLAGGCTTMQTTYFNLSYKPLLDPNHPSLMPYRGSAESRMVDDMARASMEYYSKGYAMVGYSQFVSPLYPSLAPDYAAKYADQIGVELALLEPPVPGESNLHGYLVTYWAPYRTGLFTFGGYFQDLPADLLERLGDQFNVVTLLHTLKDSPAQRAGLRNDDAILAVDGVRVQDTNGLLETLTRARGKRITVSVSRQGELLELPVDVAASTIGVEPFSSYIAPWENTAPTDWSGLSAANIAASVQEQQRRQAELDAAYRQGQLEAQQRAQSFSSTTIQSREPRSEREARARGEYESFQRSYNRPEVREYLLDERTRQKATEAWNAQDWSSSAPATYNYLFQYPAFVQ